MSKNPESPKSKKALLHLVFGGHVDDPMTTDFTDTAKLDIVGIYPNYAEAYKAWRGKSQQYVDDAHMKYVIVHLHRLMEPDQQASGSAT